jgi:hypothetical protein
MSIGPINSPATWSLGTVVAPSWLQSVQDNINGLIAGTGPTLKALQIDGAGGNSSSQTSGTLGLSAAAAGTSLPCTSVPLKTLYGDSVPAAWGWIFNNGTAAFTVGYNVSSISRTGTGVVQVTLNAAAAGVNTCVPIASLAPTAPAANMSISAFGTSSVVFEAHTFSGASAADLSFNFIVFCH